MLYNGTTMATTWHTLATGDVSLLGRQMEALCALPKDFLFLNYLRCHDDIGWGLDYPWLQERFRIFEVAHKKYLNDWFTSRWPGSPARGELYNDDPSLGDARLCGTTASLCGLESASLAGDPFRTSGRTAVISIGAPSSGIWPSCELIRIHIKANCSKVCAAWRSSGPRSPASTLGPRFEWRTAETTGFCPCAAVSRAGSCCACSTSAVILSMPEPTGKAAILS